MHFACAFVDCEAARLRCWRPPFATAEGGAAHCVAVDDFVQNISATWLALPNSGAKPDAASIQRSDAAACAAFLLPRRGVTAGSGLALCWAVAARMARVADCRWFVTPATLLRRTDAGGRSQHHATEPRSARALRVGGSRAGASLALHVGPLSLQSCGLLQALDCGPAAEVVPVCELGVASSPTMSALGEVAAVCAEGLTADIAAKSALAIGAAREPLSVGASQPKLPPLRSADDAAAEVNLCTWVEV